MKQVKQIIVMAFIVVVQAAWLFPLHVEALERGHFYVIGTGPSGPQMATLQALNMIKEMDAIIGSENHVKLFAEYVGEKPVLFDPWKGLFGYKGKHFRNLDKEEMAEFKAERSRQMDERVKQIRDLLDKGKNVGLLDSGNPCLFGPSHWYVEEFDEQDLVIIPGMGCGAAAMAALGKSVIPAHDTRFVMQTSPMFLTDWEMKDIQILKDISKYPVTMIQYMALGEPEKLFETFGKVYPADMPCAVVFWAGHPDKQRIVRGTVADMGEKLSKEKGRFMGLLLVGRFLEGKPYKEAMNLLQSDSK